MLILVVADAHIPERVSSIPNPIKELLQPGKIDKVVSLGNISDPSTIEYLANLSPQKDYVSVLGDTDIPNSKTQSTVVFKAGSFKISAVSSFLITPSEDIDVLASLARKLDADILLWGGNHQQDTQNWASHYFVNPGSISGALSELDTEEETRPGFSLLDIKDEVCGLFMYQLHGDKVKVEKAELVHGKA